jgi:hypothetical protein
LPEGPELLEPPDGTEGTVIDLMWDWDQELGANQWFELQIWPDDPEAEPEAYDWYKKMQERVTSADLAPGRYLWRVLVLEGREDERGEAMELDYAEPWLFILVRPSLKRGEAGLTPMPTDTPIPSITPTYRPVWPSATPDTRPTATDTTVPPSPTATTEPYEPPTREPTATTEPYEPPAPTPTATTDPYEPPAEPTPTNTTEPYEPPPTDTPVPAPTATTEPYEPPEPTPEPTEEDPYP